MNRLSHFALRQARWLVLAFACTGCIAIVEGSDARADNTAAASGANFCQASSDGKQVACGGEAAYCMKSGDGSAVACGGKAAMCEVSSDGRAVACGARAAFCQKSSDGSAVACGGQAAFCEKSGNGAAVACGGKASHCQASDDGRAVACGAKATHCSASGSGNAVACGGALRNRWAAGRMEHIASGSFTVEMKAAPAGEGAGRVAVGRMLIDKQYHGALSATAQGEFLSAGNPAIGSAAYVAVEHVSGTLDGREGSFALVHTGTMHEGQSTLSVQVAPGTGTGALAGMTGTLKIDITAGQHQYTLSYSLPAGL